MAHDHHFADLEELDSEFERRGYAVPAGRRFERRDQRGNITHHENLARIDIENLGGVDAAVGAGDHHDLRRLAFPELFPAVVLFVPVAFAKAAGTSISALDDANEIREIYA